MVPVPVMELTLPLADQSLPPSDQENIPPRMVTPPPLNVLVEILEEQELMVKECCRTTLAVCNQHAIFSTGKIIKSYHCPAQMQLLSVCKVVEYFKESCEQRRRVRRLRRGLGGYESSSESGEDGLSDSDGSSKVPFLG